LTGSYEVSSKRQLTFAIQNLVDARPPFNAPNYAGVNYNPTFSQTGIVGRFFRLGVHFKI